MKPDLSVLPITGWEIETVSTDKLIFIRFIYLSIPGGALAKRT
ncbi:MAG: hypothetical protein ABI167_09340 [Nitrosospira sp.]